jgi:hypothetical protein
MTTERTMTDLAGFQASLAAATPPAGLSAALEALWWDAKGDWGTAHQRAQASEDDAGSWVHAYLHRKEGDLSNAGYWYRRARRPVSAASLAEEWAAIASALLGQPQSR